MPDLWIDVDTAVIVPVNVLPLLDDTDFKTIETAVVYNSAGMALTWNFVTSAGVVTGVAVTPTTGGVYDWSEPVADKGMYAIEIPASGGASANNDTEGTGWFTGVATGVLPWRGPMIGFRRAALNDLLIDGGTASTNLEDFFDGTGYAGGTAKLTVDISKWLGQTVQAAVNGFPKVDLTYVLGTILSESAGAGALAASIIKFFNKLSPTGTINSLPDAVPDAAGGLPVTGNRLTAIPTVAAVTTVTNLTNAPTAGDLTVTMKTSVTTAASAATPAVTVSDKTGFSLSTAGVLAIWHQLTSAIVTASTIGKLIVDYLDAAISTRTKPADTQAAVTLVATTTNLTNAPPNSSGVTTILADYARRTGDYATAGAQMDLVNAPNATAVTAIQSGLATLSKLLKYVQLILRKDAAIATDNATEVTAINANGGSGAGAFTNTTDSLEAIRDKESDIETDTAEIGAAGAGLTSIPNPAGVTTMVADYARRTGDYSTYAGGAVASVTGAVGSVTGLTAADVGAIKAKTDQLIFTVANQVDANALSGGGGLDAAGVRTAVGLASANLDTQLAAVQADTDNLQTRIPAALVGGRMDSSVGAMAANTFTASAVAADAVVELSAGTLGSGSTAYTPNQATDSGGNPLDGVDTWVTTSATDSAVGVQARAYTNALGVIASPFLLDPGTYYVWRTHGLYSFTNPETITVV